MQDMATYEKKASMNVEAASVAALDAPFAKAIPESLISVHPSVFLSIFLKSNFQNGTYWQSSLSAYKSISNSAKLSSCHHANPCNPDCKF